LNSKIVYLKFFGTVHSYYRILASTPPTGYQFLLRDGVGRMLRNGFVGNVAENWLKPIMRQARLPEKLLGSCITYLDEPPPGSSMTITNGLLDLRKEPWAPVIEDAINSLIGFPYDLPLAHKIVERILMRDSCKKIIYFFEATRRSLETTYETSDLESKMEYVPLGIPLIPHKNRKEKDVVNIVFVGSVNFTRRGFNDTWFYARGGHIVIKTFMRLCREFHNLTLTLRSQVPPAYLQALIDDPRISIMDQPLTQQEFEELLWSSDICLLPAIDSPWLSFLDAMNHELPIVTVDMHANRELVYDGKWGFVCDVPKIFQPIIDGYYIADKKEQKKLEKAWMCDTEAITNNLVEAVRLLVKDSELRQAMGKAGRDTIKPDGLFSVERRNTYLKRILDEATD
jgi:glycosyltransferase involved in cell wall biosynthesis